MSIPTPNAIIRFHQDNVFLDKMKKLQQALIDESDTAVAILSAANIDFYMRNLLKCVLRNGNTQNNILHSTKGRLGEFQIKADLLYLLKLIDKVTYKDITTVGNIRNIYGHSDSTLTFDHDRISHLVKTFEYMQYEGEFQKENSRAVFTTNQSFILVKLQTLSKESWEWRQHET